MSEMSCPNCGRHLVAYRTDRQTAGQREIELHWSICVDCRHVALDHWSFVDDTGQAYHLGGDELRTRAESRFKAVAPSARNRF